MDLQVIGCSGPFQKEEEMDAGSSGFCALQQEYKLVGFIEYKISWAWWFVMFGSRNMHWSVDGSKRQKHSKN